MKKLFLLALTLILFLCGCTTTTVTETTESTAVIEATDPGLYVSESAIEQQSQGAVRRYDLPDQYQSIAQIGDKLLLVSQDNNIKFTKLLGSTAVMGDSAEIPQDAVWKATQSGLVYYDQENQKVIFLDMQLQQLKSVNFPEKIDGIPVISADGGYVFYCTGNEIRVLETEHKISRLLKTYSGEKQALLGSYFDGTVFACSFTDADGRSSTQYLSTDNGQTVATDNGISRLYTYGDTFFAIRQDGVTQQNVVGIRNETPQLLLTESQTYPALEIGGIVGCLPTESGFSLDFYAFPGGQRTASVLLDGFDMPLSVIADRWSNSVWVLTMDIVSGQQVLLNWNPSTSTLTDDASYVGTLYTADAPDEEGLNACLERVKQLNKAHGVSIRIWEDALKDTNGYTLVPEHQVGAIGKTLDEIEQILQVFPNKFLQNSSIKRIQILVVRSINSEVSSMFYWQNSDPTIILCTGSDVFIGLTKGFGYVIDSNILEDDETYAGWDELNPEDFVYGEDETYSADYLAGDGMAFLSESAMTSAREDRCQIFCEAMRPDQSDKFASETMQRKLKTICESIRNSWSLKAKTEIFPWEQYLSEPIAYQG